MAFLSKKIIPSTYLQVEGYHLDGGSASHYTYLGTESSYVDGLIFWSKTVTVNIPSIF